MSLAPEDRHRYEALLHHLVADPRTSAAFDDGKTWQLSEAADYARTNVH